MERDIRKIIEGTGSDKTIFTVGSEFSIKNTKPLVVDRIEKGISLHSEHGVEGYISVYRVFVCQGEIDFLWKEVNASSVAVVEYTIPKSILDNTNE